MTIPMPRDASALAPITEALDAADHDTRVAWVRSLNGKQLYRLFDLAREGGPVTVEDLVRADGEVVVHMGKNGVPVFTYFQKRFTRLGDEIAGYNENGEAPFAPLFKRIVGPGHYVAYDSPEADGEVWIDYRRIPTRQHPDFPPLLDNDHGLRSLVFGNMVDILRRVSAHVYVGDSTKSMPSDRPLTLGCRIGSMLATAPFALCQVPESST